MTVNKNFTGRENSLSWEMQQELLANLYMPPFVPFKLEPILPKNYQKIHCSYIIWSCFQPRLAWCSLVLQAALNPALCLLQPPRCWGYRSEPPCPVWKTYLLLFWCYCTELPQVDGSLVLASFHPWIFWGSMLDGFLVSGKCHSMFRLGC